MEEHLPPQAGQTAELAPRGRLSETPVKQAARVRVGRIPSSTSRLRVKLKSWDHRPLDKVANDIIATARRTGSEVKGPIPLPTRIEKFTVNRSPHIDKKSREQFEMREHKRLIDIVDPTPQTIDALMRLDVDAMVGVDLKL